MIDMTTRLLAFVLVLGLLPTGQLVASVLGDASVEICVPSQKGDMCPGDCCPKAPHSCRCHDSPCVTHDELPPGVPATPSSAALAMWMQHDGRGFEPPPLPPPIS